jgi:hypothetical protein
MFNDALGPIYGAQSQCYLQQSFIQHFNFSMILQQQNLN